MYKNAKYVQSNRYYYTVSACFSVVDHFYNRAYVLLDEALSWDAASDRCREGRNGYLAAAQNKEEFDFLRGMYDKYDAQGGSAIGAWIDGKYDNATKAWHCYSNDDDACLSDMPWSVGKPNRNETEQCILVWWSTTDGVVNHRCNSRMPAICATLR